MRPRSLLLVTPAICLVVGLASGAAYAYFTSSGKGTGSASVGSMQPVTVSTASPGTLLLPGGSADVTFQVTNPNSFAVTLVSVTGNGPITATGGQGSCPTANTGVTFNPPTSLSTVINPGATKSIDLPGAASMSQTSASGCQGATFSIPVTIAVQHL